MTSMKPIAICITLLVAINSAAQTRTSRPNTKTNTRAQQLTARQIAALAFPSTVSIYVATQKGDLYTGSGFVVAPNMVATCFHVVQGARRIVVTPIGADEPHNAALVRYDEDTDLALLSVKTLRSKPLKLIGEADLYVGEPVYTIGNPKGLEGTFSNGILSNFLRDGDTFYIQFTAPVSQGNSGGPLLDGKGKVIGVVNMQFKEGQNLNFAVSVTHVYMLMEGKRGAHPGDYIDNNLGSPPKRRKP